MKESGLRLETPPRGARTGHSIASVLNNNNPKLEGEQALFSFRVDHPESVNRLLSSQELSLDGPRPDRHELTERKIKLVSASPPQKTEKKRFIKLLSPLVRREEDEESAIADEQAPEESQEEGAEEVRASLNYFEEEMNLMQDSLLGIAEVAAIEEEERIAMLSQKSSRHDLNQDGGQQPVVKSKRKIVLSQKHRQPPSQQVKQAFRYCIGCQQPVLEPNTILHEWQCASFQRVFRMDYQQIAELLVQMIAELSERIDRIQSSLSERDLANLKLCTRGLLRESGLMARGGGEEGYRRQLEGVWEESGKWVGLAEQVCRLNWFITLRQALTRHRF